MKRHATAVWKGSLKEGAGHLSTQSGVLEKVQYSFKSRFEEGIGTNPEELVAAAHSGCFTMQLSAYIAESGFDVESVETQCEITLMEGRIISSHLAVKAKVKGISNEVFQELVTKAEENCIISKLLDTEISSEASLV